MGQALANDVDSVDFIHRSIRWLDLLDVRIIVVEERVIRDGERFAIGRDLHIVEVVTGVTVSEIKLW